MESDLVRKFARVSGAPRRLAELELDDMDPDENVETLADVRRIGDLLAAGDDGAVNLVLLGAFGVGKTRIATWLLRRAFEFWAPRSVCDLDFPRFFRAVDLAELRFGRSFSGEDDVEDRREAERDALLRAPVVVVDDVHRVAGYRGEEVYLESVVERRYDDCLSTILTMNELPRDGRFADFLKYFVEISIVGRSRRAVGDLV